MRKKLLIAAGLAVVLVTVATASALQRWRQGQSDLPTVRVVRGSLDLSIHTTGELRSGKSAMIAAPAVAGTLQIVRLAPSGTPLKSNDVVVEFETGAR